LLRQGLAHVDPFSIIRDFSLNVCSRFVGVNIDGDDLLGFVGGRIQVVLSLDLKYEGSARHAGNQAIQAIGQVIPPPGRFLNHGLR
jgi:hypothetical protein